MRLYDGGRMTYEYFGQDVASLWIGAAESAIRTGIDIAGAIRMVKAVRAAAKDAIEEANAKFYLTRLEAILARQEAEKAGKTVSPIATYITVGGIGLLAALSFWK